jgi:hypothetical protein
MSSMKSNDCSLFQMPLVPYLFLKKMSARRKKALVVKLDLTELQITSDFMLKVLDMSNRNANVNPVPTQSGSLGSDVQLCYPLAVILAYSC